MIIYAICLVFGLMFALFSAFAGHLFGGHGEIGTGGHADAGFGSDGMPGVSFFSPTILASFITAFGAFGLILSEVPATASIWLNAPVAFVTALVVALGVLWLMNTLFRKTQGSSEARVGQLLGTKASLASPIPDNGERGGSQTKTGVPSYFERQQQLRETLPGKIGVRPDRK